VMNAYWLIPTVICSVCFYVQNGTKGRVVRVHAVRASVGSGGLALLIPNLVTRWQLVVNIMPRLPCLRDRTPVNIE
jgi:hypothetical protein